MENYIKNYFKDAKVGDKVIDILRMKEGKIIKIDKKLDYPIKVKFTDGETKVYTIDGIEDVTMYKTQTLFFSGYEPEINIPEPPEKKFKLEYEDKNENFVIGYLEIVKYDSFYRSFTDKESFAKFGRLRKTEEAAKQAFNLQTRVMRLHALAEQLGGLKEFKEGEDNYYICKTPDKYEVRSSNAIDGLTVVWMTKECAEKVCELLNNNEFNLEVENENT